MEDQNEMTGPAWDRFRETGALLEGHFELRSGLHSDRFIQAAMLLQYPQHAAEVCRALAGKLREACPAMEPETVIAPALGGIAVGHEMGRELGTRFIFAEKEEGALAMRRFRIREGERFLVAEDVVTRGGRVRETIDIVRAHGGVVEAVAVLVDRSGGTIDFGVPMIALLECSPTTWNPSECPLCAKGDRPVHPGSR
ncbi:orotate phosphoribosyltransferase [Kiritimatiella glycovorans]|uniref:Orotate phosphoribosyltransferase n=1 Tax=Kiritimatiella glycovorans TaxID=1307763 RepID=A0A0G3EBR9_9BACT|nr:orotate phosphoribosyltransferase [Kiritimatiella glycovorans]AKJ63753.1 Orotate phosphoribosyltransferase [Kiritimatiella glycovorans]